MAGGHPSEDPGHAMEQRRLKNWESVVLVILLAFLISAGGLCIAGSMRSGTALSTAALVFLTNIAKTISAVLVYLYTLAGVSDKEGTPLDIPPLKIVYAVPAVLYTFSDNIAFIVLSKINPATFSIIWNGKTAVVAIMMRVFLVQKPFSWCKWGGVGMLLIGPTLIEFGSKQHLTLSENGEMAPIYWHALCFLGACISASANVFTEYVLKRHAGDPILWQNVQLYACSAAFTLVALMVQEGVAAAAALLDPPYLVANLSGMAILAMLMQTAQSFVVPMILKYVDNIADLFAHAGAVLVTSFASWMFFQLHFTYYFMTGMLASVCALFLYYADRMFPSLAVQYSLVGVPLASPARSPHLLHHHTRRPPDL
uniref:Uncharacterized protein n=1 Tax=Pyramimonas obovata TaxID=1411642 RepID=A0A7S0WK72_9CHLO|mmetsp:Transcript_27807/g.60839  ORF Transcript_27807/g.60839 Transcript_27807/m.60839 type:complete len:369 (+) Transcript_27807:472-1578(+)|eukprot:CAMPEP_0118954070 /NCGR_PEP_ID=MMETSP1169-20130426/57650_1 /TAXON_ID=36882 /ORGANISM="Pyramimonas obovata, Strain CCMP722" /LENGTH=368 /DNA_ID=CAMNT_0006901643 /DNA_START=416 /DNA_END=1522 /DNA_ORIENTATION=+